MTRTRSPIFISTLLSFSALYGCGGGEKPVEEPKPPAEEMPAPAEATPPVEPEPPPVETPPAAEATPPAEPMPEAKTLSEDLDGDGTPEEIKLVGSELTIGDTNVTLAALTPEQASTAELRAIDISKKDKSQELAVIVPGADGTATWWIIAYNGKDKSVSEPAEVQVTGEPTIKGNGKIVTTSEDCGQTTTTTWTLKKGALSKGKEKTKGKHDESKCGARS